MLLAPFLWIFCEFDAELREVTSYDELELDKEDDEHSCGFTTGVFQNQ